MATSILTNRSSNLSLLSAVNINYSTLTGSTIIDNTMTVNRIHYSTITGSSIATNSLLLASTLTGSSIVLSGNVLNSGTSNLTVGTQSTGLLVLNSQGGALALQSAGADVAQIGASQINIKMPNAVDPATAVGGFPTWTNAGYLTITQAGFSGTNGGVGLGFNRVTSVGGHLICVQPSVGYLSMGYWADTHNFYTADTRLSATIGAGGLSIPNGQISLLYSFNNSTVISTSGYNQTATANDYSVIIGNGGTAGNGGVVTGTQNVLIGGGCANGLTTAYFNTVIGNGAVQSGVFEGVGNCVYGFQTGYSLSTGDGNTFVGFQTGTSTVGNNNTMIGRNLANSSVSVNDETVIGQFGTGKGANTFFVTSTNGSQQGNGSTLWGIPSDINIKTNISPLDSTLSKILALEPISYQHKEEIHNNIIKKRFGYIAQDYVKVFPEHGGTYAPNKFEREELGLTEIKGIVPELMPHVVKAFQEQHAVITSQATRIDSLESQLSQVLQRLAAANIA